MSSIHRGLSLIEVIIVITLISAMMILSLPMLSSANARARSEFCQQNLVEISQTIASVTMEHGQLPTLYTLQPTLDGLSLPEFIEPRAHTPQVVFCPSDESERSHILGTSYQCSSSFNGLRPGELGTMLGQRMLADRDVYHASSEQPINEMSVTESDTGYHLSLITLDPQNNAPVIRPIVYLTEKRQEQRQDTKHRDEGKHPAPHK